jgi:hypothetical protein
MLKQHQCYVAENIASNFCFASKDCLTMYSMPGALLQELEISNLRGMQQNVCLVDADITIACDSGF